MMILLDNDAEVIWQRKKEFSLTLIESSLRRYREAAQAYGMIVIKTARPPEQLVGDLINRTGAPSSVCGGMVCHS